MGCVFGPPRRVPLPSASCAKVDPVLRVHDAPVIGRKHRIIRKVDSTFRSEALAASLKEASRRPSAVFEDAGRQGAAEDGGSVEIRAVRKRLGGSAAQGRMPMHHMLAEIVVGV